MSDRNADYAPPEVNFQRIADLWNTYLDGRNEVTPYDTAMMMVLVKVARSIASPHLIDHLVDTAGYAACAADVLPGRPVSIEEDIEALSGVHEVSRGEAPSLAEDGGQPGDLPAHYELAPGFLRGDTWHGVGGRQIPVPNRTLAENSGALVID